MSPHTPPQVHATPSLVLGGLHACQHLPCCCHAPCWAPLPNHGQKHPPTNEHTHMDMTNMQILQGGLGPTRQALAGRGPRLLRWVITPTMPTKHWGSHQKNVRAFLLKTHFFQHLVYLKWASGRKILMNNDIVERTS